MKVKSILLAVLIALSTLLFGVSSIVNAKSLNVNSNVQQVLEEYRVEYVWINGVLWRIVYDADENIIQATAVGHAD
jgi:hypothetical protein